jgi:hypothetical protein
MKKIYILICLFLLITSCQKDENEVYINYSLTLTTSSTLTKLVSRVSQNPTAEDNVLDDTSCFNIQLPVNITVNGQQITVETSNDYQTVQNVKDQYSNDNDIVYFNYPITIVKKNYTSQVISNYNEFHDLKEQCGTDDGLNEIDCIAIVYPISINEYNSNNQVSNTLTFQNNSELYNYLNNLNSNIYIAINYPISVIDTNGQNMVISSNSQFEDYIESIKSVCDDDNTGGNATPELTSVLTSGSWNISYCFYDNQDKTNYYAGYNFTFNTNGTVTAIKNTIQVNGTWQIENDGSIKKLVLHFDGDTLNYIEEDWKVIEFTANIIRTRHGSNGGGENDYLTLSKN